MQLQPRKRKMLLTDGRLYTSNRPHRRLIVAFFFYLWVEEASIYPLNWVMWEAMPAHTVKILLVFGKKIVKTDNKTLTNQPEIVEIPSYIIIASCGLLGSCGGGCILWVTAGRSGRIGDVRVRPCRWHRSKYEGNGGSDDTSGWIDVGAGGRCIVCGGGGGWTHGRCWETAAKSVDDGAVMVERALPWLCCATVAWRGAH